MSTVNRNTSQWEQSVKWEQSVMRRWPK